MRVASMRTRRSDFYLGQKGHYCLGLTVHHIDTGHTLKSSYEFDRAQPPIFVTTLSKKIPVFFVLLLSSILAEAQSTHACAADAVKQAKSLLLFHAGVDAQADAAVEESVRVLPPLRNPANRRQLFDVLEVQGYVYRANYQMRVVYARIPGSCVLMGQEIIERSSL